MLLPFFSFLFRHFACTSILWIFRWFAIGISGFCPPVHHPPLGNNILISLWEQPFPPVLPISVPALFPTNETLSQESESWSGCNRKENSFRRFILMAALWRRCFSVTAACIPGVSLIPVLSEAWQVNRSQQIPFVLRLAKVVLGCL